MTVSCKQILILLAIIGLCFASGLSAEEEKFFEWAWKLPEADAEKYPITEHYFWAPVGDFFAGGFGYSNYRGEDNEDSNSISYGAIVRPATFRVAEDMFLAFGIFGGGGHTWIDGRFVIDDPTQFAPLVPVNTPSMKFETDVDNYAVGASFFFSAPEYGIQAALDLGHYWARLDFEGREGIVGFQPIVIPFPPTIIPIPGSLLTLDQNQDESGFQGFFQFSYLIDRLYLYGIEAAISWSIPTSVDVEGRLRVDNPEPTIGSVIVDTSDMEYESNSITAFFYVRAFAVEVVKNYRVTLEPAFGVGHLRQNNGHALILGMRLNIIDAFGFSFYQNWEQQNAVADRFVVNVELGFRFGRRGTNVRRSTL